MYQLYVLWFQIVYQTFYYQTQQQLTRTRHKFDLNVPKLQLHVDLILQWQLVAYWFSWSPPFNSV